MRSIGITGSRDAKPHQIQACVEYIERLANESGGVCLHHGDCVGADTMVHLALMDNPLVHVVIHPPENDRYRAFSPGGPRAQILEPKPYLDRNHDIVDASEFLVAMPSKPETLRSGTWATVRYARKQGVPVVTL